MKKQAKRWPIWKIAVTDAGCAAAAVVLFWLSSWIYKSDVEQESGPFGRNPTLSVSNILMAVGVVATALCLLGVVWLAIRIRESRIPAWEKPRKRPHKRKRH